jgi:hypothetical protein
MSEKDSSITRRSLLLLSAAPSRVSQAALAVFDR